MPGLTPTRRALLGQTAAGLTVAAGAGAFAQTPAPSTPAPFTGAVMRVPVIVPPTIDSVPDVRARNTQAMVQAIEDTQKTPNPPRLIVFPVLQIISAHRSVSGVPMADAAVDLLAQPLDKTPFGPIVEACRRHNCYVATSTQEKSSRLPGRYFHTGFVMGPEGLVLRSPKTQARSAPEVAYIRDMADEYVKAFGPDSILPVAKTPIGTIGCYIETEAEVLETSRILAARGAEIIIHPSLEDDATPWMAIKQAIGYECQVYLLTGATSRNLENAPDGGWCGGASTIIGPDGKVLASLGGHSEGVAQATIDLAQVRKAREATGFKTTPAWGLYGKFYTSGGRP